MTKSRKFAAFIIITIILNGFCGKTYAQDDDEPHGYYIEEPRVFYAGFVAGANLAQVDGDNFAGYHRAGLNVGGIGYAQLAKHAALSIEILFSQKGSKSNTIKYSSIDSSIFILKYGIVSNYAEIPIMFNYFDKRKTHFGAGLSYSRLISATETATTAPASAVPDFTKYPFKESDLNVLAGVDFHLWKGFFLNIRFQYSLLPIRTNLPPGFSRANQYNNLWTVRLMYLFI